MEIMHTTKWMVASPSFVENRKRLNDHLQHEKSTPEKLTPQEPFDVKQMQKMVEEANEHFSLVRTSLQYALHEDLDKHYVRVLNADTQEVIREIPPQYLLDMSYVIQKQAGLVVDEQI